MSFGSDLVVLHIELKRSPKCGWLCRLPTQLALFKRLLSEGKLFFQPPPFFSVPEAHHFWHVLLGGCRLFQTEQRVLKFSSCPGSKCGYHVDEDHSPQQQVILYDLLALLMGQVLGPKLSSSPVPHWPGSLWIPFNGIVAQDAPRPAVWTSHYRLDSSFQSRSHQSSIDLWLQKILIFSSDHIHLQQLPFLTPSLLPCSL